MNFFLVFLPQSHRKKQATSTSQNVKWRITQKFQVGIPHTPQGMYGYRWTGEQYEIVPHEAEIIRQVFQWYLEGESVPTITKRLNAMGELTRRGNPFTVASVREFFKQEAYYGRLVLQKTFRDGHSPNPKRNKGQMTYYIVDHAHRTHCFKGLF